MKKWTRDRKRNRNEGMNEWLFWRNWMKEWKEEWTNGQPYQVSSSDNVQGIWNRHTRIVWKYYSRSKKWAVIHHDTISIFDERRQRVRHSTDDATVQRSESTSFKFGWVDGVQTHSYVASVRHRNSALQASNSLHIVLSRDEHHTERNPKTHQNRNVAVTLSCLERIVSTLSRNPLYVALLCLSTNTLWAWLALYCHNVLAWTKNKPAQALYSIYRASRLIWSALLAPRFAS